MATTATTIRISEEAFGRLKRAAGARGLSYGEYVEALIALHDSMRALADTPTSDGRWEQVGTELRALGLETVTSV